MQTTTRTLRENDTSIWVFPEGTRNAAEQLAPFKKGAFHMAIEAGVPIVPVCVSRYTQRLRLNSWRRSKVIIRSLPPIATSGLTQQDVPALAEQCRIQMQRCIDLMETELQQA
ncbi:1-acyl-sn-glycerol-3-phosphate acyltransferase [compost metagenome]